MKRLYVNCHICNWFFPSGFLVESPIQLLNLHYLCPKCRSILYCPPPKYFEKIGEEYKKAFKIEEIFSLSPENKTVLSGMYEKQLTLGGEVKVPKGVRIVSDRAFLKYEEKK